MEKEKRRQFDTKPKIEVIRLIAEGGRSVPEVAQDFDISTKTLYRWRKDFQADPKNAFPGKGHLKPEDEQIPS